MTVIEGEEAIANYRLLVLYGRCKLEAKGITFRTNTCQRVREEFGIKARKRADVVAAFREILVERGLLPDGEPG
jgi:hypothetical protein